MQTSETKSAPGRVHLAHLDGIRAVAALYVVMHHSMMSTIGSAAHHGLRGLALNWIEYGHLAVDVFIVLSGFCLVLPVARAKKLRPGFVPFAADFYRRRARRILPPFLAALGVAFLVHALLHNPPAGLGLLGQAAALRTWAVNLLLLQDVFPARNTLDVPLWSVAAEWKIYFLFPVLAWLWLRPWPAGAAAALTLAAAVGCGLTGLFHLWRPGMDLGHTCPWYLLLFGLGVCAGGAFVRDESPVRPTRWDPWVLAATGLTLALAALLARYPMTAEGEALILPHYPLVDAVAGGLTACALFLLSRASRRGHRPWPLRLLSSRPLVRIGTFAYSLYLVHNPALDVVNRAVGHFGLSPMRHFGVDLVLGIPLIVAACYLFFLAFERPFLTRRKDETPAELARDAALSPAP